MTKYFPIFLAFIIFSCNQKNGSTLEIEFTSGNRDTILELNSFYFTSMTRFKKPISFKNIKNISPNKFKFDDLPNDTYFGMVQIERDGMIYNVTIDSFVVKPGLNFLKKAVNLGTTRL